VHGGVLLGPALQGPRAAARQPVAQAERADHGGEPGAFADAQCGQARGGQRRVVQRAVDGQAGDKSDRAFTRQAQSLAVGQQALGVPGAVEGLEQPPFGVAEQVHPAARAAAELQGVRVEPDAAQSGLEGRAHRRAAP
jgi:hypothetical protein